MSLTRDNYPSEFNIGPLKYYHNLSARRVSKLYEYDFKETNNFWFSVRNLRGFVKITIFLYEESFSFIRQFSKGEHIKVLMSSLERVDGFLEEGELSNIRIILESLKLLYNNREHNYYQMIYAEIIKRLHTAYINRTVIDFNMASKNMSRIEGYMSVLNLKDFYNYDKFIYIDANDAVDGNKLILKLVNTTRICFSNLFYRVKMQEKEISNIRDVKEGTIYEYIVFKQDNEFLNNCHNEVIKNPRRN